MSLDKYETIFLCQIHFNSNNQEYKQLCILTRFYNLFKNQCRWSNGNDYCLRNSRFQVRVLVGTHLFRVTLFLVTKQKSPSGERTLVESGNNSNHINYLTDMRSGTSKPNRPLPIAPQSSSLL